MATPHSPAFAPVRDRMVDLDERDRARLARFFGAMTEPRGHLGASLRDALRAIATLEDDDLERLTGWFAQHVSKWGQLPRDASRSLPGYAYNDGGKGRT